MEMHRDARGFPGADSGASRTPHSYDQLALTSDPDMRPNAMRPVSDPDLRVGDLMDPSDLFAIDHSDPDEDPDWELYRKVGETRDWSSIHEVYMSHHILMDRHGDRWRIDWRSFVALIRSDIIRKVKLATPQAKAIAERVEAGQIGWKKALQALHELGAAEELAATGDGAATEYPVLGTDELKADAVGEGRHE